MFLENRQVELIKQALKDYRFIKTEIENFIERTRTEDLQRDFDAIANFILKFKGTDITNIENNNIDYAYLDFEYNALNMYVRFDRELENKIVVSKTFEVYDKMTCTYIIEDFLSAEEWENLINTSKETMLEDAVHNLKYFESNGKSYEYEEQLKKIVVFLKENW